MNFNDCFAIAVLTAAMVCGLPAMACGPRTEPRRHAAAAKFDAPAPSKKALTTKSH